MNASNINQDDFKIQPLSTLMGAEVNGVDLRIPFNPETKDRIHRAFLDYQLLVFRDQSLTKDEQVAFTKQFGTLERHALRNRGTSGHPLVHIVSNLDNDGKPMGRVRSDMWHTDKSFRPEPSMATILHAQILPPNGGDTVFVNMYAAFDGLKQEIKDKIHDLKVVHSCRNIGPA